MSVQMALDGGFERPLTLLADGLPFFVAANCKIPKLSIWLMFYTVLITITILEDLAPASTKAARSVPFARVFLKLKACESTAEYYLVSSS